MSESGVISVLLAAILGVTWAVRIEGKVLSHDREIAQLRDMVRDEMALMRADLHYIRNRIDAWGPAPRDANGRHG